MSPVLRDYPPVGEFSGMQKTATPPPPRLVYPLLSFDRPWYRWISAVAMLCLLSLCQRVVAIGRVDKNKMMVMLDRKVVQLPMFGE